MCVSSDCCVCTVSRLPYFIHKYISQTAVYPWELIAKWLRHLQCTHKALGSIPKPAYSPFFFLSGICCVGVNLCCLSSIGDVANSKCPLLSWKCKCVCTFYPKKLAKVFSFFVGKNLVTAQTQLRLNSEQQRAFGIGNICNCNASSWNTVPSFLVRVYFLIIQTAIQACLKAPR